MKNVNDIILKDHSITDTTDAGRIVAGFLVWSPSMGKAFGYVWTAGGVWKWRSPTGNHFGERRTKRAAVETLRDAWLVANGRPIPQPLLPLGGGILASWRAQSARLAPRATTRPTAAPTQDPTPAPKVVHAPPPPVQQVVWPTDAPDLQAATAAAFKKLGGK